MLQARGKAVKAMLQFVLSGSVADVVKAALAAVHQVASAAVAAGSGGPSSGSVAGSGVAGDNIPAGLAPCRVVLAWGANLVVRVPGGSLAGVVAAVQQALSRLTVGRQQLAVAVRLSAGPSLHFLSQRDLE